MSAKEYKSTVSVRMPIEILMKLDDEVLKKKFSDRTEAIITRILNSYHLDDLLKLAESPELQKEMNEKIKSMTDNSSIQKTLETMSISDRNTIVFYAKHLNEKQMTQSQFEGLIRNE